MKEWGPSIEDYYQLRVVIDGEMCLLDILDVTGIESFSAMRQQFMHTAEGFLCVFNITDRHTFDEIPKYYQKILRVKDADKWPMICESCMHIL